MCAFLQSKKGMVFMKNVGIVTICDNNYGNRLQNYAVQEIIKKCGCEAITVRNTGRLNKKDGKIKYILKNVKQVSKDFTEKKDERYKCFHDFNENIQFSEKCFNWFNTKWLDKFDFFVTGSDQVWNPKFRMSELDLLAFAEPQKRISFAASIATDSIPDNCKELFRKELKKYKVISVREDNAKTIIKQVVDRDDVEVIIDPTMLIEPEKWDKVAKKPKQLKSKKYILSYFLGNKSEKIDKEIKRIASENGCEIIDLMDKNSEYYQTGPSEFLYLEKNAFFTITDSFHSCVFSILYDTPFIVCDRQKNNVKTMGSRIDTLLSKFKLESRKYSGEISDEMLQCNYSIAKDILEIERKKALKFIQNALI